LISDASDVIIALVTEDEKFCKGTMHTVSMFKKNGKKVILDYDEEEFNPENI